MIGVEIVQEVLNGIGAALARIYDLIPNYGIVIILFTLGIRVLLLPLGIKQVRSMQAMQAIQPKIKELQQKYKGNKQKQQEEMMALYREHGVNPLGGCLPMLLQLPVLIALFAVLKVPGGVEHIPANSSLHEAIVHQTSGVYFLGANLLCSAREAGTDVAVQSSSGKPAGDITHLDCSGSNPVLVRIPYYLFALLMIGTTFYQQRQMQRASPTNQQQQTLTRILPLFFGVWGYLFPAGLVVYWTTTNLVQIGQQHFMLPKKGSQPEPEKPAKGGSGGRDGNRGNGPRPSGSGRSGSGGSRTSGTGGKSSSAKRRPPPGTARRRPSGNRRPTGGSNNPTKRSDDGGSGKERPDR
ncbi:MAG TPA: YidC/Oxa1 family membrane protein insertase [Actinomycetota bacterium]